jgi:hypothetical protein
VLVALLAAAAAWMSLGSSSREELATRRPSM